MDSMDNILAAGSSVQWTKQEVQIDEIGQMYGFPQIVKVTAATSEKYGLPENEPVMLYGKRHLLRTVAQTVEEGHYVMGKQLEISDEFVGYFRISSDFERDETPLKTFKSLQDVADYFPSKVYVQEGMTVPTSEGSVYLGHGDELTLISRSDAQAVVGNPNKPASRFIAKVRSKSPQQVSLIVHHTRLNESLTLPLSLRGKFATRSPIEVAQAFRSRDMSLSDLAAQVNYPITVVVASNRTRSPKDEFVLRTGMHLKLLGIEEHDVILAVTPFQRIIEFSSSGDTFALPSAVVNPQANEKDRNQYQTYLQNTYMATQLQSSSTNIDNYCRSVRFHVARHLRPTNPTPLSANANLRQTNHHKTLPTGSGRKSNLAGLSAIQLLSNQQQQQQQQHDPPSPALRTGPPTSRPMARRSLPTPRADGPPLPPRNPAGNSPLSPRRSVRNVVPPVPPKARNRTSQVYPLDMPLRPAPVPFGSEDAPSPPSTLPPSLTSKDVAPRKAETCEEEEIWDVWQPRDSRSNSGTGRNAVDASNEKAAKNHVQDNSKSELSDEEPPPLPPARPESPSFDLRGPRSPQPEIAEPDRPSNDEDVYANANEVERRESLAPPAGEEEEDEVLPGNGGAGVMLQIPMRVNDGGTLTVSSTDAVVSPDTLNGSVPFDDISRSGLSEDLDTTSLRSKMSQKSYVRSPNGWKPPERVTSMTVDDVANSLRYIGLSEDVVQYFYNERIDGQMLTELGNDILEDDFELSKLYRHKLRRFIDGWRPNVAPGAAV